MQDSPSHNIATEIANHRFSSLSSTSETQLEGGDKPSLHFQKPSEDSQLSTSFSSDSSNNSLPKIDTKFPFLTQSKINKSKSKLKAKSPSFQDTEFLDSPVAEEKEEKEEENQFLKKLPVFADGEEFNRKKNHINRFRGREDVFRKEFNRCRSLEAGFLPLDSVQEDKNEEESKLWKPRRKLLSLRMEDLNEFGQNKEGSYLDKKGRTLSTKMSDSKEIILEEQQENKVLNHNLSNFANSSNGSRRGSFNSPCPKLKVDEIDFFGKADNNKDSESDEDVIETIIEETEEKNNQADENKEFQAAMAKMSEEREFLKKVVKGELRDEGESESLDQSELGHLGAIPSEDIIVEENNEC